MLFLLKNSYYANIFCVRRQIYDYLLFIIELEHVSKKDLRNIAHSPPPLSF